MNCKLQCMIIEKEKPHGDFSYCTWQLKVTVIFRLTNFPICLSIVTDAFHIYPTECVEPFVYTGEGCYYVFEQYDNFWVANDNCLVMDSHLAYITTEAEQHAIEDHIDLSCCSKYEYHHHDTELFLLMQVIF